MTSTGRLYPGSADLPGILVKVLQLGAMQCRVHLRRPARVHSIETFGNGIAFLPLEELRNRGGK